uniref:Uncharacterized protein n=1 Tax=Arundo donax TaxID=35708 RepID=A0A0A8YMG5_ARUDO
MRRSSACYPLLFPSRFGCDAGRLVRTHLLN